MIILASNSPRRKELLQLTGWQFSVVAAEVDESILPGEESLNYIHRISKQKAWSVKMRLTSIGTDSRFILACDTVVVDGDEIIGKPTSAENAFSTLQRLRGRVHQAYSSLSVDDLWENILYQETCVTDVPMRDYTNDEITAYIASGDPFDKAGAYAIQHAEFHPVAALSGCYANVMGLPLCHLTGVLKNIAIPPVVDIPTSCQDYLQYDCPVFQSILEGRP